MYRFRKDLFEMAQNTALATAPVKVKKPRATVNDMDLKDWKQYDDVFTDSLWMINERDRSGTHTGDYHGNFVPQIPYQVMTRFTKRGDAVLDTYMGSGTTLIEAKKMGRYGIGIELQDSVAAMAKERIDETATVYQDIKPKIVLGDSGSLKTQMKVRNHLHSIGKEKLQMIIAHPPYHDIIKFSDDENDLSNASDSENFSEMFGQMLDNTLPLLEDKRYLVVVIGDKYTGGEWIPLGFNLMQEAMTRGMQLKSLIVKNMAGNRAKRNCENLWRYRALYGGFYIFKHEYVMIFRKMNKKK